MAEADCRIGVVGVGILNRGAVDVLDVGRAGIAVGNLDPQLEGDRRCLARRAAEIGARRRGAGRRVGVRVIVAAGRRRRPGRRGEVDGRGRRRPCRAVVRQVDCRERHRRIVRRVVGRRARKQARHLAAIRIPRRHVDGGDALTHVNTGGAAAVAGVAHGVGHGVMIDAEARCHERCGACVAAVFAAAQGVRGRTGNAIDIGLVG